MADEVVGEVRVDVHGNTEPLKRDIRQAATEAGKTIDDSIGKGAAGTAITDNIVEQVADAQAPSEKEGQKVGRAIVRGVESGTSRIDLRSRITAQLRDIEAPLRTTGERIKQSLSESIGVNEAPLRATGARLNKALTEAMGGLSDTGSAIGREWDKRLQNIDYRIARAISVGPRKAAIEAARDMGIAWDRTLTQVDERIGRMSFAPFRDKIAAFGQMWDQTLTRVDDRVGAVSFSPIRDKVHEVGDAWDQTLTRMDDRVGRFDPLATFRGIAAKWDAALTTMDDRVGRFDPTAVFKNIAGRWDEALTRMDDRVGRFDPAVTFRAAMAKIHDAAQKFNPPLTGVKAWKEKFRTELADDRGMIAIGGFAGTRIGDGMFAGIANRLRALRPSFGRAGEDAGRATADGMKKSILQAGIESAFIAIAGKAALMGPAIGLAVRAAAPLITGLIGQITVLGTALGAVGAVGAASMATMIPGIGALKIAFAGLEGEAKKALTAKFTGALGDLAGFKERVRNEIVPSLVEALETVSKLAPEINKLGTESAQAGGRVAKAFAAMLVGRKEEIGNIFGNSPVIMEKFGNAGSEAVGAIINALDALQPLVMRTVNAVTRGIENLARALNRGVGSGEFTDTMNKWYDRAVVLGGIFKNLGTVVGNFFGAAADSSDSFLTSFRDLTGEWAEWSGSMEGKNTFKKMFDDAVPVVEEVWGLLGDIAGLFTESFTGDTGGLVDFIKAIRETVIPGIESLQDTIRESGLQDALYNMAEAVLHLFDAGGGTTARIFIEVLAAFAEVVADLLGVLGPVLVPLGAFFGLFKALTISKAAFSGLLSLPSMLTKIVGPATLAATAVDDVGDAVGGAAEIGGKSSGKLGRLAGLIEGIGTAATVAAVGYGVFVTAGALFNDTIENSTTRINDFTEALEAGHGVISTLNTTTVGRGWGEKLAEGVGVANTSLTGTGEILKDLDDSFAAKGARFFSKFTGDAAGIENSRAALQDMFGAITQGLENTGDIEAAQKQLDALVRTLELGGVNSKDFAPGMQAVADAIEAAKTAAGGITKGNVGLVGDLTSEKTSLASFGIEFDKNVTNKLAAIRADRARYGDPVSGGLNTEGIAAQIEIIKNANIDMVNGVDNAIGGADLEEVFRTLNNPGNWDKFGQLTDKARDHLAKMMPGAVERGLKALEAHREDVAKLFKNIPFSVAPDANFGILPEDIQKMFMDAGRVGLKLFISPKERKGVSDEVQGIFGQKLIDLRAQLVAQNPQATQEQITELMKQFTAPLLIEAKTEAADQALEDLMGEDWTAQIMTDFPAVEYLKVKGQLLKLTYGPDGTSKWTAVVGSEAKTAKAHEDIYTMVQGPDGEWTAQIVPRVDEKGKRDTNEELYEIAKTRYSYIKVKPLYYNPATKKYQETPVAGQRPIKPGEQNPYDTTRAILPPGEPNTISPGGPSTMGFGSNLGPVAFGIATRAGIPLGGDQVVGSPNYKGDKEKDPRNVTINNYYPEPERTSDTIAMQMRLARYA